MLTTLVKRTVYDLTRPVFLKQMVWVGVFWIITLLTITLNIQFLNTHFADAVRPDDLILNMIPETPIFVTVAEVGSALQVILIAFIMWQWRFKPAPKMLFLIAAMFMLRGFVITFTPLGQIQRPQENFPESHIIARTFYYGMFFSGHTASAFIQAFYVKEHRLRPVVFLLATIQAFALLASHSHYTIDVVGGFFVAYFMTHFDFMRLVPVALRSVKWLPWYTEAVPRASMRLQPKVTVMREQPQMEREAEVDTRHEREPVA